nr:hypothetical protein OG461_05885 [Streptomyces sp. NBC_00995]
MRQGFLPVHASPEGRDYDRQIETLRPAGAPDGWMARAFPQRAIQQYEQQVQAEHVCNPRSQGPFR